MRLAETDGRYLVSPGIDFIYAITYLGDKHLDDIYRVWFKADTVKVNVELEKKNDFLSAEEIVVLTGAPVDSDILVRQVGKLSNFE